MPSFEQLKLLFGEFPVPLGLAVLVFGVAWLAVRRVPRLFDSGTPCGALDIWALAIAYAAGQYGIGGFSGFPPTDSLDWLPPGLVLIAIIATIGALTPLRPWVVWTAIAVVGIGTLALTLHGFQIYKDSYPIADRLLVLAAISLAMLAGAAGLCSIANRLSLVDFFLLTGIVGTIGVGVMFDGFNTAKLAQTLGLSLAIGGAGLLLGLACKIVRISPAYAAAWALVWTTLVSNAYFGNYALPPVAGLALLLAVPTAAALGLLLVGDPSRHPIALRMAVLLPALAAALLAFGLSKPLGAEEDSGDDYGEWGP